MTAEQALQNKIRVQKDFQNKWNAAGRIGSMVAATGVGKSKMAIDCIEELRHEYLQHYGTGMPQGLLVTPTEEMRDVDWPDEFAKWNVSTDGLKRICQASFMKEDLSKYDYLILDECHRNTVDNLRKLQQYPNLVRLGLTATYPKVRFEKDTERVELLTYLLPPVHTVTTDEAVELGLISDFEVIVLKFDLDNTQKNIQAGSKKKPFLVTEKGQYDYLTRNLQKATFTKNEGMRFAAISKRVQFMYNLPSKLRLAKQCLAKLHDDVTRTVVFAGSIEQANILCGENVFHSESGREAMIAFQSGKSSILGAVKRLNEGANLFKPDQALIVQLDSQERNLVQRCGRILRKRYDNPDFKGKIIILVARNTCDEKWYEESIKEFETSRIKEFYVKVPIV